MNQKGFLFSALLNPLAIPALRLCSIASGLIVFFFPFPSLPKAAANTLKSDFTKPLSFITRGRQPSLSFLSSSHIVPTYASLIRPASLKAWAAQSGIIPLGLKMALCAGILNRGQSSQSALFPLRRPLLRAADLLTMPPMVPNTKQATGVESSPNLNDSCILILSSLKGFVSGRTLKLATSLLCRFASQYSFGARIIEDTLPFPGLCSGEFSSGPIRIS
jgi:hypothetical protein